MSYPVVSDNPHVQAFYEYCRASGESHNIAEMCAFQQGPALETETRFMAGRLERAPFGDNPYSNILEKRARAAAARAGVSTTGKWFDHQIARDPEDVDGWVGSKSDIEHVIRKRGLQARGDINIKGVDPIHVEKPYAPAADLVEEDVVKIREQHPDMTPAEVSQAREKVREHLTPEDY